MQKSFAPIILILGMLLILSGIIGGAYYFKTTREKPKVSEQKPITPKVTPSPFQLDETVNPDLSGTSWKTYTNNDWQVSFRYPSGWEVSPNGPTVVELNVNSVPHMSFTYIENLKNLTLQQVDQENAKKDKERGTGVGTPAIAPTNYTTITTKNEYSIYYEKEYLCEPSVCERYTLTNSKKIIQIVIFPRTKELKDYSKIINQILATFKFLD